MIKPVGSCPMFSVGDLVSIRLGDENMTGFVERICSDFVFVRINKLTVVCVPPCCVELISIRRLRCDN